MTKLTRRKIGDQMYEIVDPSGRVVGTAAKTGTHLDNYPWDWSISDGLWEDAKAKVPHGVRIVGVADTLRACVDILEGRVDHYGL
jgi:hypothetical protein